MYKISNIYRVSVKWLGKITLFCKLRVEG